MKIAVIGAGSIGSLFGGLIVKAGYDVLLIDKHPDRAKIVNENGLKIDGVSGKHLIHIKSVVDSESVGPVDLVMVCVKAYDTYEAVSQHVSLVGENTTVLTLQNGFGNVEQIGKVINPEQIIAGTTAQGGYIIEHGHMHHAGNGATYIGEITGEKTKRIETISKIFHSAGFETHISDNISVLIWTKLVVNVGLNCLTALLRVNNGLTSSLPVLRLVQKDAVDEALAVAEKNGIPLDREKVADHVVKVAQATEKNVSSMLSDVLKKRSTEIDFINGAICKEGERLKVPTPVNRTLTNLVKAVEQSYDKTVQANKKVLS